MWIHFSCDVFVAVNGRGILNSLIFTKAWSMKVWIPVVSWSLFLEKRLSARARQAVIQSIAVLYELTKRTQEMLFADWAQQYKAFFVPNQEPTFAWPFGNGPVRVGTQELFRLCLKTFVAPFLPPDWPPLDLRGCNRDSRKRIKTKVWTQIHGCVAITTKRILLKTQ